MNLKLELQNILLRLSFKCKDLLVKPTPLLMKTSILFVLLMVSVTGYTQNGEFTVNDNGLIYSDNAVKKLKYIVDSLNLKFKTCENKKFYAPRQGVVTYFEINGRNARKALKDIKSGMSPDLFRTKYKKGVRMAVVQHQYTDYEEKEMIRIEGLHLNREHSFTIDFEEKEHQKFSDTKKGWIYNYSDFGNESLYAIYLDEPLAVKVLPEKYGRMVQYSECVIDTNATVYFNDAKEDGVRHYSEPEKVGEFLAYVHTKLNKPEFNERIDTVFSAEFEKKLELYYRKMEVWDSLRPKRVDSLWVKDVSVRDMFANALERAESGLETTNDEFEEYVAKYISKDKALQFKRGRWVIGGCSMDMSPRIHAMNIAELAAETIKWDIFLRSHLDIMNDRFDRVSDGSYAWQGRKTYIKELEVLDINVPELLLGICLRVENPSQNHYFGSIARVGRSLAEADDRLIVQDDILSMICDTTLDDYNRVLMFYLFSHYTGNLTNESLRKDNQEKLRRSLNTLPGYLTSGYKLEQQ